MKTMNIRKKLVSLAVASAFGGGAMLAMTAPAHAINVSQDGVGQVLLFPYYTVKNGLDTLFTVTNTSDKTVTFKVRFREALNSREVRDFNVVLSPYDHWGAVVTSTADGALLRTWDKTCTSPQLPASGTRAGATEVAFTNSEFSGALTDGAAQGMGRVQEGYFEVIQMGVSTRDTAVSTNTLEYNAKHVNGVPRDCAKVDNMFMPAGVATLNGYMLPPQNVLKGHATYINVTNGTAIDAEPTALENFQTVQPINAEPGGQSPSLANGDLAGVTNQLVNGALVSLPYFSGSVDGVSQLLRASSVINEYATGAGAATSWVMTFPTKHHYTDSYISGTGPTAKDQLPSGGFSEWFHTTVKPGMSCDNIGLNIYNREEGTVQNLGNTNFSPAPVSEFVELCYEANVVDFNGSSVFGTGTNRLGVSTSAVGTAGWAELMFSEVDATTVGGLPVIGFAATVRDAGGATVNYGSSTAHTYKH
ncbi:MAG: hypothetical protein K0M58_09605 [Thiobacillus sp.]|nr:hypothetical protein [Thiobacillus sp.]